MPELYRPDNGPLVVGLDGALYGTTPTWTAAHPGTVFRGAVLGRVPSLVEKEKWRNLLLT
jgi:hypothetical protein